jgi:hypothetical protein
MTMIFVGQNKNLKIEAYELCPCNSGNKYKFCCYPKVNEAKKNLPKNPYHEYSDGRLNHEIHKIWEDTDFKTCFGFDQENCAVDIKDAHSIQNNRILNRISVNNHVYRFHPKVRKKNNEIVLKEVSKNKASTFFGFCDIHDTRLFQPIELKEYNEEPVQNFLFAFRSLCLESHKKARELEVRRNIFRQHPVLMLHEGSVYLYRNACEDVNDYAAVRELFKQDYFNRDYSKIKTVFRKLDFEIEFAASSCFAVGFDMYGNQIQDIYSLTEDIETMYLNVYPVEGGANILLSYRSDQNSKYEEYFTQLEEASDEEIIQHLNQLIIQYTENIFFSPKFINGLTEKEKASLTGSMQASMNLTKRAELIMEDNYLNFNLFCKSTN